MSFSFKKTTLVENYAIRPKIIPFRLLGIYLPNELKLPVNLPKLKGTGPGPALAAMTLLWLVLPRRMLRLFQCSQ